MAETNEMSVALLRRNKEALVDALKANGWENLDYTTMRAGDLPKYVQWGHGLLDIRVAAVLKSKNLPYYFTVSEWMNIANEDSLRSKFLLRGLRLRAMSEDIVISADSYSGKTLSECRTLAAGYKAFSADDTEGSIDDTATWSIPTKNQLQAMYRYKEEINAAFNAVWGGAGLAQDNHWSNTHLSGTNYWAVNLQTGIYSTDAETAGKVLRLVQNLKA